MVKKISEKEFNEMDKTGYTLIDFSAKWCGPCQMLAPVLEEVSEEYADKMKFYTIDVDESAALAMQYKVVSIPALVVLKDGEKVNTQVGFVPKDALKQFIDSCMK